MAFPDRNRLAEMFEEAGMIDIKVKSYTGGVASMHMAESPSRETEGRGEAKKMAAEALTKTKTFMRMIKVEHTVFALPFAFLAMLLGSLTVSGQFPTFWQWLWVTVAMVGARSAAMSLNRVIDANIDKHNPRTAQREIPAGLLSKTDVWIFIVVSFALLFLAAFQLNMLSVYLLPIAVFFSCILFLYETIHVAVPCGLRNNNWYRSSWRVGCCYRRTFSNSTMLVFCGYVLASWF